VAEGAKAIPRMVLTGSAVTKHKASVGEVRPARRYHRLGEHLEFSGRRPAGRWTSREGKGPHDLRRPDPTRSSDKQWFHPMRTAW